VNPLVVLFIPKKYDGGIDCLQRFSYQLLKEANLYFCLIISQKYKCFNALIRMAHIDNDSGMGSIVHLTVSSVLLSESITHCRIRKKT
jgi:hypothetical protein